MDKILTVGWTVKPGAEERLAEIVAEMTRLTRQEPGCVAYYGHRSEDGRRFLLYERYTDEAAFEAHTSTDYFACLFIGEARELMEDSSGQEWTPVEPLG